MKLVISEMEQKKFALELAQEAGEIMFTYFRSGFQEREWKSDDTPVTIADKQINEYVQGQIAQNFPNHGFIGEEGSDYNRQEYTWVCDPIDGTRSFARGIPVSTFSLALLKDGQPILGVVYQPFLSEMYSATLGGGALRNKQPIHVSTLADVDKEVAIACPAHKISAPHKIDAKIEALALSGANAYNYGSAAYNAVLVAAGSVEGTIFPWKNCWDVAAAKIIIEEAGGKTSDVFGNPQQYNQQIQGFIGSNGLLHEKFILSNVDCYPIL